MSDVNSIVEEFDKLDRPAWAKKVHEIVDLKDKEIEQARSSVNTLKGNYLKMEEQKRTCEQICNKKQEEIEQMKGQVCPIYGMKLMS